MASNQGTSLMPAKGKVRKFALEYNGVTVTMDQEEFMNLTAMWKAAGSPGTQRPNDWFGHDSGRTFIESVAAKLNTTTGCIWKSKRGKYLGGTWAHWQVGLAYAKYLNPEFHQAVNTAFREWCEERNNPDLKVERAIESYRRKGMTDSQIEVRMSGKLKRNTFTSRLKEYGLAKDAYGMVTNATYVKTLGGTARELREARGLPLKANLRDHLSEIELSAIAFAESMAEAKIRQDRAFGTQECLERCKQAGEAAHQALASLGLAKVG